MTLYDKAETVVSRGAKFIGGAGVIIGALAAMWVEFIGPGFQSAFQSFAGVTELKAQVEVIENRLPAPPVVAWNEAASGQVGACNPQKCDYILVASRTEYGELCGAVASASVLLRKRGDRAEIIRYKPSFQFVRLTRQEAAFEVPLDIPARKIEGQYQWRSEATYENCPGRNEPIVRVSPWFELDISTVSLSDL